MHVFQFHPAVARWFEQTFGSPTEPQVRGWPAIQSGRHVLISAPTGSGKTLAAFLASLDALFREGVEAELPDEIQVVYVSPLKALSNARTLILDEIHAVVDDRRGAHLALSVERLAALTRLRQGYGGQAKNPLQRIGLSATQKPIDEVERFLVGTRAVDDSGNPDCDIIDIGHRREM